MATNNFKPFAIGAGANVVSQTDYEAAAALLAGFQSGKASSAQINKAIRQSSVMAYVLAQFISDSASVDVLDNGTPATILSDLKAGIKNSTTGRLLGPPQIFTTGGTYTPRPGTKSIIVEVLGGGGGGGGIEAAGSSTVAIGNGGGAGGYAKSMITAGITITAITVGTGGAGGNLAPTNGSDGGLSSFGSLIVAYGGGGGFAQAQIGAPYTVTPSLGGTSAGGNIVNSRGGSSSPGVAASTGAIFPGNGGASFYGGQTLSPTNNGATPLNAFGYGNGGGGGFAYNRAGSSGGAGAGGVVIVWEYA